MNQDGIPDVLQQQQYATYAAPASYAAPAVQYAAPTQAYYAAPAATATVTGVDMNYDGIPDVLQQPVYAAPAPAVHYAAPAPAVQYVAPAPAVYAAAAPAAAMTVTGE